MKNLETLIRELCPDGVEFVKLGDVCKIKRGIRVVKKDLQETGKNPVYQNSLVPLGYKDEFNYPSNVAFVISAGAAGDVGYSEVPFWAADDCLTITCPSNIENKYVYYFLKNYEYKLKSKVRKASIPRLSRKVVDDLEIPLPPIEVQTEIVRILDKFTSLEAELEAELDCRKRQYEYYRDKLLSFDNVGGQEVEWKKMSEVGTFIRGNGLQKKDFTEEGVGCIHYGQLYTHYGTSATETITYCSSELAKKLRKAAKGDIVIATTSENVEDVCKAVAWLGEEEIAVSGDAFIYKHTQNPKYMAYLFQTASFFNYKKKKATGTKVIRLTGDAMGNYLAPIPSLEEQHRIVSILDRFESLTTSLQSGLPAEITARRQQYEHYRDKLLTFKRKGAV